MNRDVHLCAEASLPERLLEKALAEGAEFARIRRTGTRRLDIHTDARSANILLALCKKYGICCRVLHRSGKTRMRNTLQQRWTVLPGIVFGALICAFFLSRVWLVDICFTDKQAHPEMQKRIAAYLAASGIQSGMAAARIDSDDLQTQLSAAAAEMSYVGVHLQGIRLLVEASPEVPAPDTYVLADRRDLLAARNGVVESVIVYSGEACVQPGDTVLAGEVLIRGEEAKTKEETTPVGALGKVIARCWFEGSASCQLVQSKTERTGRSSTGCSLRLGDFTIPVTSCESYPEEETEIQSLPIVGRFLPLKLERSTHYETRQSAVSVDQTELEGRLTALACADALQKINAAGLEYEIASQWTDAQQNGNTLQIRAVYEIYTDIAAARDAMTEEVY